MMIVEKETPVTEIDDVKCQRLERLYCLVARDPAINSHALLRQLIAAHGLDPDIHVKNK
jgi:hypothetical protein